MGLALADLISQLQGDVPQRGNVPSTTQYQQCVTRAVADYSRRRPILRRTELDIVQSTAEYDLPDDFWKLVAVQSWDPAGGVMVTGSGLVPVPTGFEERYEVLGRTLVIHPTPTYTLDDRDVTYLAVHVLSGEEDAEEYAYLTDEDADILLKKAAVLALKLVANSMAVRASDYSVRDVRENASDPLKEIRQQIKDLDAEYEAALRNADKTVSMLGHGYSQAELEAWL